LSAEPERPPPLAFRNTLREGLAIPKVLGNPLRRALTVEPFGNGRPVLVVPGMLTGDISTSFLRRSLAAAGFEAHGWRQGLNAGANPAKLEKLEKRLASIHSASGRKVVLIGWSLGGLYARVLAQRMPRETELVMTIASPFSSDRRANRAWRLYELINDHRVDAPPFAEDPATKPEVRTIAVWSAVDGVVAPECTMGREHEADHRVRVDAQHFALGSSARSISRIIGILREHLPDLGEF
jgi:pimeloyl-ACP methyl ester carboxylesterase